jgi:hypothetical protein
VKLPYSSMGAIAVALFTLLCGTPSSSRAGTVFIEPPTPTVADTVTIVVRDDVITGYFCSSFQCCMFPDYYGYCSPTEDPHTFSVTVHNCATCDDANGDCVCSPVGFDNVELARCELGTLPAGVYVVNVQNETVGYVCYPSTWETVTFQVEGPVPAGRFTWGHLKQIYR